MSYYAVILAGGKGERFWPLSTSRKPKQLLSLVGERPLLAQAVERLAGLVPPENVFVITNRDLVEGCCEAAPELPRENVIGEPIGRDTAAAVALGAALVKARDPDGSFCVLTADHVIGDVTVFQATLKAALDLASREDVLITIGIPPTEPSTGYGYIEAELEVAKDKGVRFLKAKRFVEKPDLERARTYVASDRFFWNSGMFIWSVKSLEKQLAVHTPHLVHLIDRMAKVAGTPAFGAELEKAYSTLAKISIDYALMEKAPNIVMARGAFSWDDVGSWTALENHFKKDTEANVIEGQVRIHESKANIVYSRNHMTALVGVDNVIVVQAEGVTLVCAKDKAQDIKKLVEQLRREGGFEGIL